MVMGRLQQRTWTAEHGAARSVVEVMAEELGPSLRWATATTTRATRSPSGSQLDRDDRWRVKVGQFEADDKVPS
jgi:single-stranded DNA-binding protein